MKIINQDSEKHLKVQVWIYARTDTKKNNDELLVLLLLTRPGRGSFWQPVTGSVELGETLSEAALREAKEETGLTFKNSPCQLEYDFTFASRGKSFHEYCFAIETPHIRPPVLDSNEHTDFQWMKPNEARNLLKHSSNQEALYALLEALGSTEK